MKRYLFILLFIGLSFAKLSAAEIDAFIETVVSKAKVYEKETVLISYRLYTKSAISSIEAIDIPKPKASMKIDSKEGRDYGTPTFRKETYNGKPYYVADIKTVVVIPEGRGKITIPAAEMTFIFAVDTGEKTRSFFGVEPVYRAVKQTLSAKASSIDVQALPIDKLSKESEAVGVFKLQNQLQRGSIDRGQAFVYEVNVKGVGGLEQVKALKLELPEGLELLDQQTDDSNLLIDGQLRSEKSFYYKIVSQKAGRFVIPAIDFVYFDTEQKKYIKLTAEERAIEIKSKLMEGEAFI